MDGNFACHFVFLKQSCRHKFCSFLGQLLHNILQNRLFQESFPLYTA
ncbi:hypothetical protein MXB_4498, partial [Myxobolus squamalis]